jgi:hypothetical protein
VSVNRRQDDGWLSWPGCRQSDVDEEVYSEEEERDDTDAGKEKDEEGGQHRRARKRGGMRVGL